MLELLRLLPEAAVLASSPPAQRHVLLEVPLRQPEPHEAAKELRGQVLGPETLNPEP